MPLKKNRNNNNNSIRHIHHIGEEDNIEDQDITEGISIEDHIKEAEANIDQPDQQGHQHSGQQPPTLNRISSLAIPVVAKTTLLEIVRKTSKCLCDRT